MTNIETKLEGDILTIKVDISKRFEATKSGKSITIATTSGNVPLDGHPDVKLSINVYTPIK